MRVRIPAAQDTPDRGVCDLQYMVREATIEDCGRDADSPDAAESAEVGPCGAGGGDVGLWESTLDGGEEGGEEDPAADAGNDLVDNDLSHVGVGVEVDVEACGEGHESVANYVNWLVATPAGEGVVEHVHSLSRGANAQPGRGRLCCCDEECLGGVHCVLCGGVFAYAVGGDPDANDAAVGSWA